MAAARQVGLAMLTYGRENNEPENVKTQAELGVKGAILDEVGFPWRCDQIAAQGITCLTSCAYAVLLAAVLD